VPWIAKRRAASRQHAPKTLQGSICTHLNASPTDRCQLTSIRLYTKTSVSPTTHEVVSRRFGFKQGHDDATRIRLFSNEPSTTVKGVYHEGVLAA
jgi:hypothetical protein